MESGEVPDTARAERRLRWGTETLLASIAGKPLETVLEIYARGLEEVLPGTHVGVIALEGATVRCAVGPTLADGFLRAIAGELIRDPTAPEQRAFWTLEPVVITEPRWPVPADALAAASLRIVSLVPLVGDGDERNGVIVLARRDAHASPADELEIVVRSRLMTRIVLERDRKEQTLRARAEQYMYLFDSNPHPMWVFDLETLRFLAVNNAAIAQYGYTRDEFLAMTIRDIRPADDHARLAETVAKMNPWQRHDRSWRHLRKDGRLIWVEVSSHMIDFQGRAARVVVAQDITKRHEAEAALAASEQRFRLLSEVTNTAVWDWDIARDQLWWNEGFSALTGVAPGAIPPGLESWTGHVAPADRERVMGSLRDAMARGDDRWRAELQIVRTDGALVPVVARARIVYDENRRPVRMIGGIVDITDRLRAQEQMMRTQRLESIGTLAGGIAHDLNNVLAPIMIMAGRLREEAGDADALEAVEMIQSCAQRGADMVRQLLAFARGRTPVRAHVDVATIVDEVRKIATDTFPPDIHVDVSVAPDLWLVDADATQLHQLLTNLCVNARDAMPAGGTLTIRIDNVQLDEKDAARAIDARPGPHVRCVVADTGAGMSHDVMDRMFEPFFTTKEVGKGTGLGLSMAHAIVRTHGGFIEVTSAPGAGTRFEVYLPALPDAEREAPRAANGVPRGHGELVLVVDDEPHIRSSFARTLEAGGYRTLVAANGAEAVAMYAEHRGQVAAVLTDMAMPVMDGPATVAALRAIDADLPIVASSGRGADSQLARLLGRDARYVAKPFTAETLLRTIHDAVNRRS